MRVGGTARKRRRELAAEATRILRAADRRRRARGDVQGGALTAMARRDRSRAGLLSI
jgi:hypothetical protein